MWCILSLRKLNNSSWCWNESLIGWKLNWGPKMPSFQIIRTSLRFSRSPRNHLTHVPCSHFDDVFPQGKLDTLSGKGEGEAQQGQGDAGPMNGAVERIRWIRIIGLDLCQLQLFVDRELELELAQTKLALVETECKNQDLTHQFTVTQVPEIPLSPDVGPFNKQIKSGI